MRAMFEKNIEYLQRNIPPDDIYIFAEETFMAALFFLHKWAEWVDINVECHKCIITQKWVKNIMGLLKVRDAEQDFTLDLGLDELGEE